MAGARAQHPLGNRETPRIAAGIFPISGASGQRMRRYFFGASPPGEGGGREQREKAGSNRKRQEQQEGAGNNAGAAMPEMPDNAARHANRQAGATCRTDDRRRAAGGTQQKAGSGRRAAGGPRQKAGGGRAAIRRAGGSIALKGRFHVHTNSDYRAPELRHSNGLRQRESGNDPEPAPPRSGKKHAGKQVLSTEIPRIHRKRDIRRPLTNYH